MRPSAALLAPLLLAACLHDAYVAPAPAGGPDVPQAGPRREPEVRVLVFGDFGWDTHLQWLVARAMTADTRRRPFDLALQLGDNLYKCGPSAVRPGAETCRFEADGVTVAPGAAPPDDPIFLVNERPLAGLRARGGGTLATHLALGNHDVASSGACAEPGLAVAEAERRKACLAVARRTDTWVMPARRYVLDRGPLRFVVFDSNLVVGDYGGFTLADEVDFVRRSTEGCGPGRACFLVGHHPPAAVHHYRQRRRAGPTETQRRMAQVLAAAGGRARGYLGGHVHLLEHLRLDGLEVFISGSTAMGGLHPRKVVTPARAQVEFATDAWGYAVLEAGAGWYRVSFTDYTGTERYCCEAEGEGACRAERCR
jgi:hypothetical protein